MEAECLNPTGVSESNTARVTSRTHVQSATQRDAPNASLAFRDVARCGAVRRGVEAPLSLLTPPTGAWLHRLLNTLCQQYGTPHADRALRERGGGKGGGDSLCPQPRLSPSGMMVPGC